MVEVVVEFDYKAVEEDELTIRVGDIISNVHKHDGGWWEGEISGRKGMFPDNFVKEIKKDKDKPRDTGGASKKSNTGGSGHVAELANKLGNIKLGQSTGVGSAKTAPMPTTTAGVVRRETDRRKMRAKVAYSYTPANEDELRLEVGNVIDILKQEEEGWWEGNLNGKVGMFPSNFVEVVDDDKEKTSSGQSDEGEKGDSSKEDHGPIQGKKVRGVGLGNIFSEGPIKLRTTTATIPRKSKQKDGEKKPEVDNRAASQPQEQDQRHSGGKKGTTGSRDPPTLPPKEQPREHKQDGSPPCKKKPSSWNKGFLAKTFFANLSPKSAKQSGSVQCGQPDEGFVCEGPLGEVITTTKILGRQLEVIHEVEHLSDMDQASAEISVNRLVFLSPDQTNVASASADMDVDSPIIKDELEGLVDDIPLELSGLSFARETPPPRPTFRKRRSVSKGTPRDSPALPLHQSTPNNSEMPPVKKYKSSITGDESTPPVLPPVYSDILTPNQESSQATSCELSPEQAKTECEMAYEAADDFFAAECQGDSRWHVEREMAYTRHITKSLSDSCIQTGSHLLKKVVSFAAKDKFISTSGMEQPPAEARYMSLPYSPTRLKSVPGNLDGRKITDSIQLLRHRLSCRDESGVDEAIQASEQDIMMSSDDVNTSRGHQNSTSSLGRLFSKMISVFSPSKMNVSPHSPTYRFFDSVNSSSEGLELIAGIEQVSVEVHDNPVLEGTQAVPLGAEIAETSCNVPGTVSVDGENKDIAKCENNSREGGTYGNGVAKNGFQKVDNQECAVEENQNLCNSEVKEPKDKPVEEIADVGKKDQREEADVQASIAKDNTKVQKRRSFSNFLKIKRTERQASESGLEYCKESECTSSSDKKLSESDESGSFRGPMKKRPSRWRSLGRFSSLPLFHRPSFLRQKKTEAEEPVPLPVVPEQQPLEPLEQPTYLETLKKMGRLPPSIMRVSDRYNIFSAGHFAPRPYPYARSNLSLPETTQSDAQTGKSLSHWSSLPAEMSAPAPENTATVVRPKTKRQGFLNSLRRRATISTTAPSTGKEAKKGKNKKFNMKAVKRDVKYAGSDQSSISSRNILARVRRNFSFSPRKSWSLPRNAKLSFRKGRISTPSEDKHTNKGSLSSVLEQEDYDREMQPCASGVVLNIGGQRKPEEIASLSESASDEEAAQDYSDRIPPVHVALEPGAMYEMIRETLEEKTEVTEVEPKQEAEEGDQQNATPSPSELSCVASNLVASTIYTVLCDKNGADTSGSVETFFCRDNESELPDTSDGSQTAFRPGQHSALFSGALEDNGVFENWQIFDRILHDSRASMDLSSNTSNISLRGSSIDERSLANILSPEVDAETLATCRSAVEVMNAKKDERVSSFIASYTASPELTSTSEKFVLTEPTERLNQYQPQEVTSAVSPSNLCPPASHTGCLERLDGDHMQAPMLTDSYTCLDEKIASFLLPDLPDKSSHWEDDTNFSYLDHSQTSYTKMDEKVASFLLARPRSDADMFSENDGEYGMSICDEIKLVENENANNNIIGWPTSPCQRRSSLSPVSLSPSKNAYAKLEDRAGSFFISSPAEEEISSYEMPVICRRDETAYEKIDNMVPSFLAQGLSCDDERGTLPVTGALSPESEARLNELVANTSANALLYYSFTSVDSTPGSPELEPPSDPAAEDEIQM